MSLVSRVLGAPGQDNLLRVTVNAGTRQHRLQFDCGDRCLHVLSKGELGKTDALFLSHLHMDHIGGFDALFRALFDREGAPVDVYGPPGTADILHHRFRGFWWNQANGMPGEWVVHDVHADEILGWRFRTADAYASREALPARPHDGRVVVHEDYAVRSTALSHGGVSLGYRVDEAVRVNVVPDALARLGRPPGPWLGAWKAAVGVGADGVPVRERAVDDVGALDAALAAGLFEAAPRDACAYLTDFRLDAATHAGLVPWLAGVGTLVCESQYAPADTELAARNSHTTIDRVATLARDADVGGLVPIHLSERYETAEWEAMLAAARAIFGATSWPAGWTMEDARRSRT